MPKKKKKYLRVSDPNFVCKDRITFSGTLDLYITRNIRKRYSGVIINEGGSNFSVLIETSYGYHSAARTLQPGGDIELRDFPLSRIVFQSDASAMFTVLVWASERPEAFVRTSIPTTGAGMTSHALLSTWHLDTLPASPVLGDLIAANSSPVWQRLAGNILATKKFLTQTGTGVISALPAWGDVDWADILSKPSTYPPSPHATSHQHLGADEINVAGLAGLLADAQTPVGHNLLSGYHSDALTGSVTAGDLIYGNATPKWARLAKGTDGQYLSLVSGLPAWVAPAAGGNFILVQEQILSAAATDVDFTGLDINTDKRYHVSAVIKNALATEYDISMFVNGDYTSTNYYYQYLTAEGSTVNAGRVNGASGFSIAASSRGLGLVDLVRDPDGYLRAFVLNTRYEASALGMINRCWAKTSTVTNVTSLRFHAEQANGLAAGSRFALYKVTGA